jgi:probable O-glycosylation ligase (exosortase A-associated)
MLRTLVVLTLVAIGSLYTLRGPFYALLFYIGNAYFRPEQWEWTGEIGSLNLSYVSSAWLLLLTLITRQRFILTSRTGLLLLFLLHTFISAVYSDYSASSWPFWIEFLKIITITYLIVVLTTDLKRFRLLLLVIILGLGLEQARQGWYYLLLHPGSMNMNPVPFLGDNNGVGAGMVMLVPIIAYIARTTPHVWIRRGYGLLIVGCLYRALSTYSRGAFLACAAMGGVYLLRSRQELRALAGIVVIVTIVLPVLPDAFWARMDTIQTYEEDDSATGRLHFWEVALAMADANPWFGVGFNAYKDAYNTYDFSHGEYGKGRSVHSSFFGVLADTGYMGFVLWMAILVSAFWSCYWIQKHAARESLPVELTHGAVALEASLVAFVVSGSFLPGQYGEMFWHFIGITIVLQQLADQHRVALSEGSGGRQLRGVVAHAPMTPHPEPMDTTLLSPDV